MLKKVHAAHGGIEATMNKLARENIFWPGMNGAIRDNVKECDICLEFADKQSNPPMQTHEVPSARFQTVSMDLLSATHKGKKRNFVVTSDHFSDFFELDIVKDLSAKSLVAVTKQNFARHGIPTKIVSDNGTNFDSSEFRQFARSWGVLHVTSSPHHQQGNDKAESAVKIVKKIIKKCEKSGEDLWYAILHWRNTPNKMDLSLVQRLFSRRTRCGIPTLQSNLQPRIIEGVQEKISSSKLRSKYYYDRTARKLPELQVGQPVMVQLKPEENHWSKGKINHRISDRAYMVNVKDALYRRSAVHIKPRHDSSRRQHPSKADDAAIYSTISEPSTNTTEVQSSRKSVTTTAPKSISQDDSELMGISSSPNKSSVRPSAEKTVKNTSSDDHKESTVGKTVKDTNVDIPKESAVEVPTNNAVINTPTSTGKARPRKNVKPPARFADYVTNL
ncbi:PREDICTED: uncharacterized protein LOC105556599 [Vollenhovia emeryi]|uniref:uncharacterized protein LOC105556599 n=1 Tax=Vollenhovia emeryi TaxID=411798 RepID=UPI0005F4B65E|nr:PREDICTED: uncharacterized protein LOC105556599 [Vollenhovia emeryi]